MASLFIVPFTPFALSRPFVRLAIELDLFFLLSLSRRLQLADEPVDAGPETCAEERQYDEVDAVGGEKEDEEDGLKSKERDVGCVYQGRGGARGEY